ncbi:MAG TPA: FHA domain-containing protein [Bellilinea sp.]|jgi:pSer/pThr/pTyr-binding forkhead associated (FHA) protein|nr:FHA domain-containing protein [Bellilinea sp.]
MSGIVVLILRIFLAAALYAFLGWALYTLWRDLRMQTLILAAQKTPTITLTRIGMDEFEPASFQKSEIFIGRELTSSLPIIDDTVSGQHARLAYRHNQWWVEDLKSTNGTFLNDEPVQTMTVLVSGDEIRVGQTVMKVEIAPRE